jgi:hypothetical protein
MVWQNHIIKTSFLSYGEAPIYILGSLAASRYFIPQSS